MTEMVFRGKPSVNRRLIGSHFEAMAVSFLQQQGLTPLVLNYHCKLGEIDAIMLDQGTLVFIEVRYRKSADHGNPLETVNQPKQRKLIKTAQHYLYTHPAHHQRACRFDVIGIEHPGNGSPTMHWIKNAFME